MGTGNQYIQLVKIMYHKLHVEHRQGTANFPTYGPRFEEQTSEMGGKCVTTLSPCPPMIIRNTVFLFASKIFLSSRLYFSIFSDGPDNGTSLVSLWMTLIAVVLQMI